MTNRLDPETGILNDIAFDSAHPELAAAIARQRAGRGGRPRDARRPVQRTVTVDSALEVIEAERERARKARDNSPLARLIPGFYRLP